MADSEKTILWLRLAQTRGIGPVLTRRLYEHFGSIEAIFGASEKDFAKVEGIRQGICKNVHVKAHEEFAHAEHERCEKEGVEVVPLDSPAYPKNLAQIPDPPPLLYVKGKLLADDDRSVAVIGSRTNNDYGEAMAKRFGSGLARFGVTVVSGLARGIDSLSQQAAADAGGRSVTVLGTGVNVVYPPELKPLYDRLCAAGAVISEFPLGTPPDRPNFPYRNRIISGMTMGLLLVQATNPKSGALITVKLALDQGKTIYAVPGNAATPWSRETNRLIKSGAVLVEDAEDIVRDLFPQIADGAASLGPLFNGPARPTDLTEGGERIYSLVPEAEEGAIELDSLIRKSGMDAGKVQSLLIELELFGVIEKIAGGKWRRKQLNL